MWMEQQVIARDLERLMHAPVPWEKLDGKTVLVTGATGLIGSNLVNALLYYGLTVPRPPQVLALVRSEEKARRVLGRQLEQCPALELVTGDVTAPVIPHGRVDYIVHAAARTASRDMVEHPVETIHTTVEGTRRMLELARERGCQAMVYLSSMEVYGTQPKGKRVTEQDAGALSPTRLRNSYPLSKQLAECLCAGYAAEYGVPVKILRPAQTFGPGVPPEDNRVFAMIARCARQGEDVVLRTTGQSAHSFLYTMDAVSAILTVLLQGEPGQAYNAANEQTYCSIADMARLVCDRFSGGRSKVVFDVRPNSVYPDTSYLDLDTAKLQALGWKPEYGLLEMYETMIETMR